MGAENVDRREDRTQRIKRKIEQEFPGHSCVRVIIDYPLVHCSRLDDDTGFRAISSPCSTMYSQTRIWTS